MSLEVKNLQCDRQHKALFQHLNFTLKESGVLLVEGANGSGKSSLLRLLTGLATPAAGEICWHGQSIQDLQTEYWRHLHYCGHSNGIKHGLTVAENLQLAQFLYQENQINPVSILEELQLQHELHTKARYLSAGQKRRIALAKLFLYPKKLWILDEPLTALDVHAQTLFFHKLQQHIQVGGMAIISSHHPFTLAQTEIQHLSLSC